MKIDNAKIINTKNKTDSKKHLSERSKRLAVILSGLTFLGLSIYNAPEKDKFESCPKEEKEFVVKLSGDKYIKNTEKKEDKQRTEAETKCSKISGILILGIFAYGISKILILERKEKKGHKDNNVKNGATYTSKDFEI